MRTVLICHEGAELDENVMPRWLASFSELRGIVVIRENRQRLSKRIRREIKRVGWVRFADVLGMRLYYRLRLSRGDRRWASRRAAELRARYPEPPVPAPILRTHSPNSAESEDFIRRAAPDVVIARCKSLLKKPIFSIPRVGTFVMHPGVCPEYRNAHGCFWALAKDDLEKVGMTLLRIDEGVDTGPVFGYFTYDFDEVAESHLTIQQRVAYENLDAICDRLVEISEGRAHALDTRGRVSATWGQPWLSAYLKWKYRAGKRNRLRATSLLYHNVIEPGDFASSGFLMPGANRYKLEREEFRRQLAAIGSSPEKPSAVLDFLEHLPSAGSLFLTFDDGGASAYTIIAGMLEERGWRGHFFITTDFIGKPGFVTGDQICELRRRGHVIGSHSVSHPPRISACSSEELRQEWAGSVGVLTDLLGEKVITASIPGGFYSRAVAESAAACGIRALFTSEPTTRVWRVDGCRVFGEFSLVHGSSPELTARLVAGRVTPRAYQHLAWNARKYAKAMGGGAYARVLSVLVTVSPPAPTSAP